MSGLYLAAGAMIGVGIMGAARIGDGWGACVLFGGALAIIASICDHYREISK